MALYTPAAIRFALLAQLAAQTGLVAVEHSDNPPVPCLLVRRGPSQPRTDYGRTAPAYQFIITALVQRNDLSAAQAWVDDVVGRGTTTSVWDALESDRTIGGTCHTILVGDVTADTEYGFGEQTYLGCQFTVETHPKST